MPRTLPFFVTTAALLVSIVACSTGPEPPAATSAPLPVPGAAGTNSEVPFAVTPGPGFGEASSLSTPTEMASAPGVVGAPPPGVIGAPGTSEPPLTGQATRTLTQQLADLQQQLNDSCRKIPIADLSAAYGAPLSYIEIPVRPYESLGCHYQTPDGLHRMIFHFISDEAHAFMNDILTKTGFTPHPVPGFDMETQYADSPGRDNTLAAISVHGHGLWYQLWLTRVAQPADWNDSGESMATLTVNEGSPEQYQAVARVIVNVSPPEPIIR